MYEPTTPPSDQAQVGAWALRELMTLARLLGDGAPHIVFAPQGAAPKRPREGLIVNANGTTWNPGGGAGLYQYLGGAWVKL